MVTLVTLILATNDTVSVLIVIRGNVGYQSTDGTIFDLIRDNVGFCQR